MLKKLFYKISIICIAVGLCLSANESVYANPNNESPSFEQGFTQFGYKSVYEAISECQQYFKQEVKLPYSIPSIPFTHQFGQFWIDKSYHINDNLNIQFVNKYISENIYSIDIRPLKNKINYKDSKYAAFQKLYKLENGQEAIFDNRNQLFNFLIFEKGNWQYMLGIHKKASNKVTPEMLVEIANSID